MPTLNNILPEINSRPDLPKMCRSLLYKFMKQINFRREGRPIYYLDEIWLNDDHTKEKVWVDSSIQNQRQAFIDGLSTGLKKSI
ncbi:hypothetical protein NQ317_016849 [Molorchus minor]|uniref:Uncharacterized protein n=1 Tax=Molorchus minor TaxID=1323400 RepID=A0ABQ9JJU1_9CUCU|nr:hypothetical protein NQ317_016849 [Molorchus minor]